MKRKPMAESNTKIDGHAIDGLSIPPLNCSVQPSLPSAEIRLLNPNETDIPEPLENISLTDVDLLSDFDYESLADFYRLLNSDGEVCASANPLLLECLENWSNVCSETESNDMTKTIQSTDECSRIIKTSDSVLPVLRSTVEKSPKASLSQPISLSNSVAVTDSASNPLQLRFPLETTYRPRYKSDYFPQNGIVRRPRYVADSQGNHFVTLIIPHGYNRDFKTEYVRVALITTSVGNQEHYYSPYKFQRNHTDMKVPDQNPIYLPVPTTNSSNLMKLQLVLIKSKLDQLYDAQPLKPFSDTTVTVENLIHGEKLPAKKLIAKYKLDKAHLAFTLCTKLPNGSYDVHPETTVISSVITEASTTAPAPAPASVQPKPTVQSQAKQISCPNCKHCFDPNDVPAVESRAKRKTSTRCSPSTTTKQSKTSRTVKKRKTS